MEKVKTNPGQKLVIGLMRLFSLMPLKWHHKFSAFFSWVMKDIMHYREDVVTTNIARSFPEMKYNELKEVKKKFYRHFGDIITEAIWFSGKTGRKGCEKLHRQHVLEFKNVPEFNRMYLDCSSMLVLNSHMGNWELSGGIEEYNYSSETFAVKPEDLALLHVEGDILQVRLKLGAQVLDGQHRAARFIVDRREAVVQRPADHGGDQLVHVRLFGFPGQDHLAVPHHGDLVADLKDLVHLMRDIYQGYALLLQVAHHLKQLFDFLHCQG